MRRLRLDGQRTTVAALAAYTLLRLGFAGIHPVTYTDTAGYESTASAPLWSVHFLAGIRGFTVPLVYKLIPNDTGRIGFQLLLSIVAWAVLAVVFSRSLRTERGRLAGLLVVLLFSLTSNVVGWDPLLLSESLTLSLYALLVAAVLVVVRRPSRTSLASLLLVAALWTFVRDSNGTVVLVGGLVALLLAVRPGHRAVKLATAAAAVALFAAGAVTADVGNRWQEPFHDIVARRFPEQASMTRWVYAHTFHGLADTRRAYTLYLATHPVYLLVDPFFGTQHTPYSSVGKADSLLDPQLGSYVSALNSTARPVRNAVAVLWIDSLPGVLAFAAAALAAAVAASWRRFTASGWVAFAVLCSAYPSALAAWHLIGIEIDRHALVAAVALRLGAYLLAAYALDSVLAARAERAGRAVVAPAGE